MQNEKVTRNVQVVRPVRTHNVRSRQAVSQAPIVDSFIPASSTSAVVAPASTSSSGGIFSSLINGFKGLFGGGSSSTTNTAAAKDSSGGGFLGGLIDGALNFVNFAINALPTVEKLLPLAKVLLPAIKSILDIVKGLFGGGDSSSTTSTDGSDGSADAGGTGSPTSNGGIVGATRPLIAKDSDANDPNAPMYWNGDNAPYGVTMAGWSPQDHTNLTLADLGVPGKAEKYAVYYYLRSFQVQPTKDWAPAAADWLNKQYGTNVYYPIDGETLGFGNEYVHSAPNGYGLPAGTYNPDATGEFFYGWH